MSPAFVGTSPRVAWLINSPQPSREQKSTSGKIELGDSSPIFL